MFLEELKKIWRPKTIFIMVVLAFLFFYSFMYQWVKPFFGENDSFAEKMRLLSAWVEQYGNSIDQDEFLEIEKAYEEILDHTDLFIRESDFFRKNGVQSYEDYLAYEQRSVNGQDGYDYTIYSRMRQLISQNMNQAVGQNVNQTVNQNTNQAVEQTMNQSPMYLQEYADAIRQYRRSGDTRSSILPFELLVYAGNYLVNLMILCLLCVFFTASPVMVGDRESNVTDSQYSSKAGKKIYKVQYLCMMFSSALVVSVVVAVGMLAWRATGTSLFAKSDVSSFLNTEHFVVSITFKEYIVAFIIMSYLLAFGAGSILFYLSAHSLNMVSMLLKSIPVVVGGVLVALLLQDTFCERSAFYQLSGIKYCEIIVAAAVWIGGMLLNCGYYRVIRKKAEKRLYF